MMRLSALGLTVVLSAVSVGWSQDRELVEWKTQQLSDVFFSEGAAAGDFNKDGQQDIVSGPFWYEGPGFTKKHEYYPPKAFDPHGYSDNFFAYSDDFNNDGWTDILIYGFPGQDASWFENPQGRAGFWPRHKVLDVVDNESPTFVDLNGDGRRDIVCSSEGYFGFAEVNRDDPTAKWKFRRISDQSAGGRFTHGLGFGDVNGDGRLDLLEKSGWWEQPASLDGDPQWKKHAVQFSGPGGAQMFAYDVDGDGDNDVITSLAAHGWGLAWHEQTKVENRIEFKQHLIMGDTPDKNRYGVKFSQLHAVDLVDIDGDGLRDIITGKRFWAHGPRGDAEPNAEPVVYWFQLVRRPGVAGQPADAVDWVPHLIHGASGVGVEVKAVDVNGDKLPDIVVGNKRGTFVSTQSRRKVSAEEWERAQPRPTSDQAKATAGASLPTNEGLTPQEAAEAMTAPQGFHVQLAAGEPLVHQPVAFTIDERGRLWVAEAHTYPERAPEGKGQDRIIILEDRDLNGSFETRKVFIEGLNLVSGLEVGFGGAWVGAAPYLLFIPDQDGDDVPDPAPVKAEPEAPVQFPKDVPAGAVVLLDGFGWQDTHETLNGFLWGPDGWMYACHGVFTHSRVGKPGTPDDQRQPMNAAVWRYHPVKHQFEVFAHGTSNPWGVDFNDHGQAFNTACVIPHLYHIIQGARYQRQAGQHFNPYTFDDIKTIADHAHYAGNIADHAWWGRNDAVSHNDTHSAGGGHAHCGAMIYLGDSFPREYRNTLFMANIHGNRINNDGLRRDGSGFVGYHRPDFLFANDRWFRGINLKYGPDGSVFLIDWYDRNACHRRQPEIWDRTNGRIYRISYGSAKPKAVDLGKLDQAELVALTTHDNDWYVRTSRRLLQERVRVGYRNEAVKLHEVLEADASVPKKLRAMWTLHAAGGLGLATTLSLLKAAGPESEYLRGWAVQLELENGSARPEVLAEMNRLAKEDTSPVVRLYLAAAMQRLPLKDRWTIAEGLLARGDDAADHNLPLMNWYAVEPLVVEDTDRALNLAAASRIPQVSRFIYRRAALDPEALTQLLTRLGRTGDEDTQRAMLEEIVAVVSSQARLKMPAGWPEVFAKLSQHKADDIRDKATFITVKFGDTSIFPALRTIVSEPKNNIASRRQALSALLEGEDQELPALLHRLIDDAGLRSDAIRGLARFDHPETPAQLLNRYSKLDDAAKSDAVSTLASRPAYALALLSAMEKKQIPRTDLSAFTVGQMERLKDEAVLKRLNEVWGTIRTTPDEKLKLIADYKAKLKPNVLAQADLSNGRHVYRKTCAKCHTLFGDGVKIGPDITGSNRANLDYALQNIIDPSAVVGRDYQMTIVELKNGRVLSGLIREENETALVMQTANEPVVIPKAEIEERTLSPLSLMPEGQFQQMTADEFRDLIAYLASPSQVPLPGEGPVLNAQTGKVAGALEGESLKRLELTGGNSGPQGMGGFKADRWSDNNHLWWTGGKKGDRLVLEFPVAKDGSCEVFAVMTKARDYGIVQLSLDGTKTGGPIDLFNAPDVITTGVVSLGQHDLKAGPHRLTVEIIGANPKAVPAHMFGLDYLYLARRPAAGERQEASQSGNQ